MSNLIRDTAYLLSGISLAVIAYEIHVMNTNNRLNTFGFIKNSLEEILRRLKK
jgi:hypothetical protein